MLDVYKRQREGRIREDSLMRYKIPTRLDMGSLQVEFESSYEQTGPFGAKSIGEMVINTPAPAIALSLIHIWAGRSIVRSCLLAGSPRIG